MYQDQNLSFTTSRLGFHKKNIVLMTFETGLNLEKVLESEIILFHA